MSNTETLAIENFINFCDDMIIAEESAIGDIKKIVKPFKQQIQDIKIKIKESHGNPKEQIKCYKEALEIINDVESKVNAIEVSKFEENVRIAGVFIAAIAPLVAEIIYGVKSGTGTDKPDAKFMTRLMAEAGIGGAVAVKGSIDLSSKKDVLDFIKKEKMSINMIIRYLESSPSPANEGFIDRIKKRMNDKKERKQKVKDANNYQNELVKKAKEKAFNDAIPHIKKITDEVHNKCVSFMKYKKINIDISEVYFENNDYEAHAYFSFNTYEMIGRDIDLLHEMIDGILKKYRDTIDEYGIQDYVDEGFDLYISR